MSPTALFSQCGMLVSASACSSVVGSGVYPGWGWVGAWEGSIPGTNQDPAKVDLDLALVSDWPQTGPKIDL